MRVNFWICATVAATFAAQDVADNVQIDDQLTINSTAGHDLPIPPACADSCREQFPINLTTACTHHQVFTSDATRCAQRECPRLQDVLDWQTYYAAKCELKARDKGISEISLAWSLFGIATLSVIGRLMARLPRMGGPGLWWDDWLVLGLWVLSIEMAVCLVYLRRSWSGRDAFGIVDSEDIQRMLMWIYISVPFYVIGTYGTKVAWVALYLRMWEFNTAFRKMCWATIAALVACMVGFSVGAIIVSWPLHYYLGDTAIVRLSYKGIQLLPVVYSVAGINIALDFWVLLLPLPKLMSLAGVSKQRKTGICVVFLLGFVVTAISIVRLRSIFPLHNTTNVTWDYGHFGTWSEIELHLGMISCNLPAVAGLVKRLRSRKSQASRHVEAGNNVDSIGSSRRTPPNKTPTLDTWRESSATTLGQRLSEDEYDKTVIMLPARTVAPG